MLELYESVSYRPLALKHQTINRWLVCGPFEQTMKFVPVTITGEINTWLLEGFAIHENPCRRDYVEERRKQPPAYPFGEGMPRPGEWREEQGKRCDWSLYSPWGNPRVDRSGFWFVPTRLVSYAATQLHYKESHRASFRLRTCGAVTLWVNGELVIDFVPYKRNKMHEIYVEIDVREGMNRFETQFEDLAERDTEYYFQLDYCGGEQPDIVLPIGDAHADDLLAMERALEECRFEKETAVDEEIALLVSNPFDKEIPVVVSWGNFFDGVKRKKTALLPGGKELILGHCDEIGMGYHYFSLDFWLDGLKISRKVGLEAYLSQYNASDAEQMSIQERKAAALNCIAERGSRNIHTAVAMLHAGGDQAEAEQIIREGIARINAREDCSDFYLAGLFRLWKDYRHADRFDDSLWELVESCATGFRYWIDEPGDDVMWFFSENHALLFHTCELLAGQCFPDRLFSNSGITGEKHRLLAEERLLAWFERFFEEGLAEWNSNAYIPIDAVGLLHIYDMAESDELKQKAKQAMDLLFYYVTVHSYQGRMMSTFGRSYEKELKGHYVAGTTSMCWIGYGVGNMNAYSVSNVIFSLTDYAPPAAYREYLQPDGKGFVFRYEQGAGGYARLYHYKTKDFVLSSIEDFRPGHPGYQEHIVHFAATPEAQAWVNHPGELHSYGSGRPSFWAGNGTLPKAGQHRGLAVLLYRLNPEHDADYTHLFLPIDEYDEWQECGGWLAARKGDAYIAVWCANGMKLTEAGVNRRREWISAGLNNVWVLRASSAAECGSYEQFVKRIGLTAIETGDDLLVNIEDPEYGPVSMSWEQPWTVNGKPESVKGAGVNGRLEHFA